jgi:hypothetical protein
MPGKERRRLTLIARSTFAATTWHDSIDEETLVAYVDSMAFIPNALRRAVSVDHEDVARVVVDRVGTPAQFLQLLAALPQEYLGDVLYIRTDGDSFLSASGSGGDRLLYALKQSDVDFYLDTMRLVGERVAEPDSLLFSA